MDSEDRRQYSDIGTQTSPLMSPILAAFSHPDPSIPAVRPGVAVPAHSDCIAFERSPEDEERISTTNRTSSSEPPSFEHSLPLLPSFPSSFGLQRYTGSSRLNPSNNRSVSLPETLYDEDLRLVLSQLTDYSAPEVREQPRVVSMPESSRLHAQRHASENTYSYRESTTPSLEKMTFDGRDMSEREDLRSSSSTPSTPETIVMHSLSWDQYHTPSPPPSSCDSVEFTLEDQAHVPDTFLRGSSSPPHVVPAVAGKAAGLLEDDGWLTWANSPPRPIPALHGPSSLPYARCPSGAEGTIIGEPSSLPRMIWGLDPNDAVPNSHLPQSQPSRAVSIKPPSANFKSRYGGQQGPTSTATPVTFGSSHVGPRFGNQDLNYNSFEQLSQSRPATLDTRREDDSRNNFHRLGMIRGAPDLGLNVIEEPIRRENRYEHVLHDDGIMDYAHLHSERMAPSDTVDRSFELLPVEREIQRQRQLPSDIRNQKVTHRQHSYNSTSRKGHPSNLIELLSSPVNLLDRASHAYSRVAYNRSRLSAQGFIPSFLPTPPSSSSPQWSSVFSPLRNNCSSNASFSSHGNNDPFSDVVMRQQKNNTNDELSDELRRFVFENMSPISSANTIDTFQAFPLSQTSAANIFLTSCNGESSSESPAHPPGLPIPQHILLSKALEPFDPLSAQRSASPKSALSSPGPYTRSTLSNPRSIPLSRLRQKRGAIKLATVPEEDSAETHGHDGRLALPSHTPLRVFLRTPSPLDGRLHAQSMEEKTSLGEDVKLGHARVKLPHRKGSAQYAHMAPVQNSTPQDSPKKKRLQRRKRPVRTAETGRTGFPLVAEGTVWFSSSTSSPSQDIRKEEDQLLTLACAPPGRMQLVGKGVLGRHMTARRSDKG